MIAAEDIRIGNLVWYYDYNMVETTFRVEGILDGYIYNTILPKNKLPLNDVHPVKLEVDHLLEFNFLPGEKEFGEDPHIYAYKYNRIDSVYIRDEGYVFQPLVHSPDGFIAYGLPVSHLHQLQNLFYDLTREDIFIM
jgi:hypothetical protein